MSKIVTGMMTEYPVRFFIGDMTDLVQEMQTIHQSSHVASAAAGRALMGTALMSAMLKNDSDKITTVVDGDGPIGKIVTTVYYNGDIKCDIFNPNVPLITNVQGKLNVASAVGKGTLLVIRDLGLKQQYSGRTDLVTSEIGDDFSFYFYKSEQVPSVVSLGVLTNPDGSIKSAGGFIVQVMPDCPSEMIDYMESWIPLIDPISTMIADGKDENEIARHIFTEYEFTITGERPIRYKCDCSNERIQSVLIAMGRDEILATIEEQGKAEVKCHFCNKEYVFSELQLKELLLRASK